jgi:hypothetical protein
MCRLGPPVSGPVPPLAVPGQLRHSNPIQQPDSWSTVAPHALVLNRAHPLAAITAPTRNRGSSRADGAAHERSGVAGTRRRRSPALCRSTRMPPRKAGTNGVSDRSLETVTTVPLIPLRIRVSLLACCCWEWKWIWQSCLQNRKHQRAFCLIVELICLVGHYLVWWLNPALPLNWVMVSRLL